MEISRKWEIFMDISRKYGFIVYSNSSMMKYGNLIWNLMGYKTNCQWLENSFTYR